ncbi:MAG: hypothetical protein NW226_12210 [Microscillaceae bacterium]|nr:hypothetical protein [Microscillaceae bacterium]
MLKKLSLLLIGLCFWQYAAAQDFSLENYNRERLRINRVGMIVLGTWALGNMAVGGVMLGSQDGASRKFYEMNIYWNLVNLGLAGAGLYQTFKSDPAALSLYQSFQAQQSMEKILLFNAGLDVGYMAAGLWMWEKSKNQEKNKDLLEGFGKSILMQGGFLLLFDVGMYFVHQTHWHKAADFFQHIQFTGQSIGLRWQF